MKKLLYLLLATCMFLFISCSGESGEENNAGNNEKTSYFEEFTYLPKYPGAKKISFTESTEEGVLSKAEYSVPDTDPKSCADKYATIIENDGWTVQKDEQNNFLTATKDDHIASILFHDKEGDVKLIISSK